jgi:hypothetical protein
MHPIGRRQARVEADAALDVAKFEPAGDCHGFRQHLPVIGDQHRRLLPVVEPRIFVRLHVGQHVDAAQPIGLAEPFQRGDEPHRTSQREAVNEDRFHFLSLSVISGIALRSVAGT